MKKIFILSAMAVVAMTISANPVQRMMATKSINPQKAEMMSQQVNIDRQVQPHTFSVAPVPSEIKAMGARTEKAKLACPRKAVLADTAAMAFYMKPEGTLFTGIDRYGTPYWCLYNTAIIGSWLNGVDTWVYKNYSMYYTDIKYLTLVGIDYGEEEDYGWSINENGDFIDTLVATSKGQYGYYSSLRKPLQIVSNATSKDTFMLNAEQSNRLDTCWYNFSAIGGALCPKMSTDGLWPLTNAMGTTIEYGEGVRFVWNITEDNQVSYIFGTTTIIDSVSPTQNDTIVPSLLMTYYEKPMSPLYVKDVTMPIVAYNAVTKKYIEPKLDSVVMMICDTAFNVLAASVATINDTSSMYSFPGKMLNFKIQKKSEYGSIEEGITLNQPFMVIIMGLNRPANNFGIWSAYSPYTSGNSFVMDVKGKNHHYAPYDPYIMLNGIYATVEHASHNSEMFKDADYGDSINIAIRYSSEDDIYYAVHADGEWEDYGIGLCATQLLYDTTTYQYLYKITAPDWAVISMGSYNDIIWEGYQHTYWSYFSYFDLYIDGDPNDEEVEQPQVGDEIKLNYMGREMVFTVTEVDIKSGLNSIKYINDNKRYDVLGKEVDENYKGVVIRNGKKMLQ